MRITLRTFGYPMSLKRPTELVVVLFVCLNGGCTTSQEATASKERLIKAQTMFAERCKSAGEKIYRKVENVDGIFLLKLRPQGVNFDRQFDLSDPYGSDLLGVGYLESFIRDNDALPIDKSKPRRAGYRYVEAISATDGKRYRYSGHIEEPWQNDKHWLEGYTRFVLDSAVSEGPPPRYGVTYDDISTKEERDYWIAGSSLKIIDLATGEVIAERRGYMIDVYQGSRAGGRSPWLFAADHACPEFTSSGRNGALLQSGQADKFVEKVLIPAAREKQ